MYKIIFEIDSSVSHAILGSNSIASFHQQAIKQPAAVLVTLVAADSHESAVSAVKRHYSQFALGALRHCGPTSTEDLDVNDWLAPFWFEEAKKNGLSSMVLPVDGS